MKTLDEIRQRLRKIEDEIMYYLEIRQQSNIVHYKKVHECIKKKYVKQYANIMNGVLYELDVFSKSI